MGLTDTGENLTNCASSFNAVSETDGRTDRIQIAKTCISFAEALTYADLRKDREKI